MKRINLILHLIITIIVMTAAVLVAQPKEKRPPKVPTEEQVRQMVDEMAEELMLTQEQKDKILILHEEHFNKLRKMFKTEKERREKIKEEHHQLKNKLEDNVRALINNEQVIEYDEFIKKLEVRRNQERSKEFEKEE